MLRSSQTSVLNSKLSNCIYVTTFHSDGRLLGLSGSVIFLVNSEKFRYMYEESYVNYLLFFSYRKKNLFALQTAVKIPNMECDASPSVSSQVFPCGYNWWS
jgi:hypothetical protein